jgi:hypothetical protein
MKWLQRRLPLAVWAARDVLRRPGQSVLMFACLGGLVFISATALLFSQALDDTWSRLLDQAPDLVVRRIDGGSWAPLPSDEAAARAKTVAGVIRPIPRVWGIVAGPGGPVTLVTLSEGLPINTLNGIRPPAAGQAVVGWGVQRAAAGNRLILGDRRRLNLDVVAVFPKETGLTTHDLVWANAADARRLLGLAPGQASDLAVYLFRREEEQAIQADLTAAFPWPVRITARRNSRLHHHLQAERTGGIAVAAGIPALLALLLLLTAIGVGGPGRQAQQGLLRALGWTCGDIVKLQIVKASIVGLPALALGLASAEAAVFYPPAAGVTAYWITGGQALPALSLNPGGAILVMIEIVAMVGLPCLATVFLTSLRSAAGEAPIIPPAAPWN